MLDSFFVIGGSLIKQENYGHFIGPIIDSLKKDSQFGLIMNNEEIYEGEIINNQREGFGKVILSQGYYYNGQWHNNKKEGLGIEYRPKNKDKNISKIIYEGQFKDDLYNGFGKYIWENGDYFEGYLINGKCNGKGRYYRNNGELQYEGDFVNNIKHGYGYYSYGNGNYYYGNWEYDKENGYSEYY